MSEQTVSGTFKLEYKNSNGRHDFVDAHYRIVDKRGRVLRTGKTNKHGKTESATIKKGEPIYIELKDLSKNTWESASPRKKLVYTPTKSGQSATVLVSNCYFQAKLMANKWVNFKKPWRYEVVFQGDNNKKITLKGTLDEEGKTKIYDSQKMPMAKNHENTAIARFEELVVSSQPNVEVIFIEPITGERFYDSDRVIPIGSDKKYREFQIQLTPSTTKVYSEKSTVQLQEQKQRRTIILDIDMTAGATYTITREDNKKFFDNKLAETKKSVFKDGTPHTVYIPKKYNGKVLLKKGSKTIATFPLEALDPNDTNAPVVFCLSNKVNSQQSNGAKNIHSGQSSIIAIQTDNSIPEGEYDKNKIFGADKEIIKKLVNSFLNSLAFDGGLLPVVSAAKDAAEKNNRRLLYDTVFAPLFKKGERVVFYVKKSKTGKTLIIFKGYSGLRKYLDFSKIGTNHLKVGMISAAADIAAAKQFSGGKAALETGVKATVKGTGLGFILVAAFDIAEWWSSDDPFNNWSDLFVSLGIDLVKTAIATATTVAVSASIIIAAGALGLAAAPVALVVIGGIGAGIAVSFALEYADRNWLHTTEKATNYVNKLGY